MQFSRHTERLPLGVKEFSAYENKRTFTAERSESLLRIPEVSVSKDSTKKKDKKDDKKNKHTKNVIYKEINKQGEASGKVKK
jgi:hypothetical protein